MITLRLVGTALGLGSGFFAATASGATPALPVIPSQTFYITNYGAVGDGVATNLVYIPLGETLGSVFLRLVYP